MRVSDVRIELLRKRSEVALPSEHDYEASILALDLLDARQEVARLEGEVVEWKIAAKLSESLCDEARRLLENSERKVAEKDAEIEKLKGICHEWIEANGVGGWIDDLRHEIGLKDVALATERKARERSDARVKELGEAIDRALELGLGNSTTAEMILQTARVLREPDNLMPCGHPVSALSDMQSDFIGDTPATQRIGTVHCRECERIARGGEK